MLIDLSNKIALVTGASRGIGKSIAEHLANSGATVIGTATTLLGVESITENLKNLGNSKSYGILLNTNDDQHIISATLSEINKLAGDPLILVNNAGINKDNLFLRMTEEDWDKVIKTNLYGTFRLTKFCIKPMLKIRWGRIINISSIVAFSGNIGQVNYTASKAGIIGFSKSLAQEVASRNITVNIVAPGFIDTDMTKTLQEPIKKQLLNKIPMARLGDPDEVAKAVVFLSSDYASYITGNTMHINGGMFMD